MDWRPFVQVAHPVGERPEKIIEEKAGA